MKRLDSTAPVHPTRNGRIRTAFEPDSAASDHREIRRVMFFGKNMSRTRCTGGLVDAWRNAGVDARWLNMATLRRWFGNKRAHERAERMFERFRPDVVFVFCRDLPPALLASFRGRTKVVLWIEEALHNLEPAHVEYYRQADLLCLSNESRLPLLRELGIDSAVFLMSGFSPRFHRPRPSRRVLRDIAFIGGPGWHGQRAALLAELAEEYRTEVFGCGWEPFRERYPQLRIRRPVNNVGYAKVCATSRIVLGMNEINVDRGYFSNRTWLTLACRGFHLTHYVPGLEQVFEEGRHLAWFRDRDEAFEKVRMYLADHELREQVREQGYRFVLANHQYSHRVERVVEMLKSMSSVAATRNGSLVAAVGGPQPVRLSPSPD